MREPKQFQIGDSVYTVKPLGAITGRKVFARLVRALGRTIGGLDKAKELDRAAVMAAISAALDSLDDDTVDFLCEKFGESTTVLRENGRTPTLKGPIFDDEFSGKYAAMTEWLVCCVEVNFADFFDGQGLSGLLRRVGMMSKSPSQTGSTGSSGEY